MLSQLNQRREELSSTRRQFTVLEELPLDSIRPERTLLPNILLPNTRPVRLAKFHRDNPTRPTPLLGVQLHRLLIPALLHEATLPHRATKSVPSFNDQVPSGEKGLPWTGKGTKSIISFKRGASTDSQ